MTLSRTFPCNIVKLTVITEPGAVLDGGGLRMTREGGRMSLRGGSRAGCMSELRLIFFRAVIYCGIVLSRIRRLQPCQRSKRGGKKPREALSVLFYHSPFMSLALFSRAEARLKSHSCGETTFSRLEGALIAAICASSSLDGSMSYMNHG